MAAAIEQFIKAMNKSSKHWKKEIIVTARDGRIETIHCGGFTWSSDVEEKSKTEREVIEK